MIIVKPSEIDDYIAGFPKDIQLVLEQIRATILTTVPEVEETISYGMPAFKLHEKYLVYVAAHKKHIGLYPVPVSNKAFEKDFSAYKTSGKGTIQFPLDQPMPLKLISKILKFRVKENLVNTKITHGNNYIKYHNDGSIWAKGKTVGNVPEGYWEWFRKEGTIMRSGYFNNGKQTGEWTTYDKQGQVYKVTQIKYGKPNKEIP